MNLLMGGKNVKALDFPIFIAGGGGNIGDAKSSDPQKSSRPLAELIKTAAKKKKKRNGKKPKIAATKNAKTSNEFYGYSELEAILKADDSIINDPDKGILEWADSVLNPSKFYNFSAAELLTDNDDGEESDVIDDVLEDEDDEDEGYIPFKAANPQHRIGVCPKCSSTQTLINFVWECECTKARDISDSFFGIVNDWTQNPIYHGNFQNGKKNGNFHAPTFNASKNKKNFSRGKIYEKKNVYQRGKKDINILTNKFEAVSLNQSKTPSNLQNLLLQPSSHPAPPSSRSSPPNKKPILRSLLQDDPIWALPNSINFAPPTTLYDLITESDDYSTIQHKDYVEALGLKQKSSSGKIDSIDAPILRALLSKPPKIAPKSTSTQTFKCHHQPI
uniref:Uncharacterized protein n=1 Tax=Panagrolaimus superbus TaxID=310955 RepID=A0A914YSD5_9BILA